MKETQEAVARALLQIKAVEFKPSQPIKFKSGIVSPVYVDNRRLPYHPIQWQTIQHHFRQLIEFNRIVHDVIAGVAVGGVPHSATLGYLLQKPSVFVRKQAKDHGKKKLVEGGEVKNKRVLLIEDLVTTGSSSLAGVQMIRDEGGIVQDVLAIVGYDFIEAKNAFEDAKVTLHTLTNFEILITLAVEQSLFAKAEEHIIRDWFDEPRGWAERHGYT